MGKPYLEFRERQGLATLAAVTVQCVLDRTDGNVDLDCVLREIEDIVAHACAEIRERWNPSQLAATPTLYCSPISQGKAVLHDPSPDSSEPYSSANGIFRLPAELLRRTMSYLPHTSGAPRACFSDLTMASSVCRRWRSIALSSPELWSVINCRSDGELGALKTILPRSGKSPLHINMDLRSAPGYLRATAIGAVTEHMHRVEVLILTHDVVSKKEYERLLATSAPLLQTLYLRSPTPVYIRRNFLGGNAPRLATLALAAFSSVLPLACPALANVTELRILESPGAGPSIDDARRLFVLCPLLRTVRLDAKLSGAPANAQVSAPAAEFKVVRDLTVSERGLDGGITLMIPTLKLFDFSATPRVHLRAPTESTAGFFVKPTVTANNIRGAFVVRAGAEAGDAHVVVLRDADGRSRALSELTGQTFEFLLKKVWAASGQLTALALSERLLASDTAALAGHNFPALRTFSVFVQNAQATPHILDVYHTTRSQWEFPALAELVFETHAPVRDVFSEGGSRPELSASRILAFYANMIQRGVRRRPRLILDGVVFRERFAGPEVNALRETFSEVVVYS